MAGKLFEDGHDISYTSPRLPESLLYFPESEESLPKHLLCVPESRICLPESQESIVDFRNTIPEVNIGIP